jgi:uncharacterized cupredoxin-like copper-binding protein
MAHIETMSRALAKLVALGIALAASSVIADGGEHHDETYGKPGDRAKASRTLEIDMSDAMRFMPASIAARKGETIRFVVKNSGKVKHEMVLGSLKELKEHAALMLKFPEMEHADQNQISVDPGKTGELVWQFTKAGTVNFACLQPGHFEAGMRGKIAVK